MLPAAQRSKIRGAMEMVCEQLGVPAVWEQTKPPQATVNCTVGFKTIGVRDEELVNAYGVGGKVITIKAVDVPHVEKFDRLTIMNERYTVDAAAPIHINGELVFWKAFVKGK